MISAVNRRRRASEAISGSGYLGVTNPEQVLEKDEVFAVAHRRVRLGAAARAAVGVEIVDHPFAARNNRANTWNGTSLVCDSQYGAEHLDTAAAAIVDGFPDQPALSDTRRPDDADHASGARR